jgi:hypothetical protein
MLFYVFSSMRPPTDGRKVRPQMDVCKETQQQGSQPSWLITLRYFVNVSDSLVFLLVGFLGVCMFVMTLHTCTSATRSQHSSFLWLSAV